MTAKIENFWSYIGITSSSSSEDTHFSKSKKKSMKFKHKVYDHKRKVGIDFGCFGPNSLGIRGQKGPK